MPKIYMPDLIDIYSRLNSLMNQAEIPLQHRLEIAKISGVMAYYVKELTKDVNVEVTQ
jgi:hypothetical protein